MEKEEKIQQMLQVLAQAKTWPGDLLQGVVQGRDMDAEIKDVAGKNSAYRSGKRELSSSPWAAPTPAARPSAVPPRT